MARPKKEKYNVDSICKEIDKYINTVELPILKELCYLKNYNYDYIMQLQRKSDKLSQSIKRLLNKKEVILERKGLNSEVNSTMAIFSLKQLGWKDKQIEELKEEREMPEIKITVVDNSHLEKAMYEANKKC